MSNDFAEAISAGKSDDGSISVFFIVKLNFTSNKISMLAPPRS